MTDDSVRAEVSSESVSLTNWSKEPSVSDLKQDLTDALHDHTTQTAKVNTWLDNLYVRGSAKLKASKTNSTIVPKLIRKQAEWRYASLSEPFLSTPDLFNVDPHTHEDMLSAKQNGLVLNYQFNVLLDKVRFINDYIRVAVNEGTVICKVGWESQEKTVMEDVVVYEYVQGLEEEDGMMIEQLMAQFEEDPTTFKLEVAEEYQEALRLSQESGFPVVPREAGIQRIEKKVILKNQPFVEVCDHRSVIIDPTCHGDLTKAGFIIHSFETSMSDLEKDGRYKNLDKILVTDGSLLNEPDSTMAQTTSFNFRDKPRKKLIAYEYWGYRDIDGSGITKPIVATWVGNVMVRMEENPFPDQELPFIVVPYLPIPKQLYGEPDGELLEDNQKVIGAVTRGMVDLMGRSANSQIGTKKGALDAVNRTKFLNGQDFEYNGSNPQEIFHMHKYPEIPQSAPLMLQMQNNEAEALTGVKGFSGGISGNAMGSTATGVRSAMDATAKRDLDILRRLGAGIERIGRKIIAMNKEWLSELETIRITNEEFVQIRREDLGGKVDLRLTISTAEADNQKADELSFMLQTLGNNVDFGITKLLLAEVATLRKMPTLAKKLEQFNPQPDPIAVKKAELELELLQSQINESNMKAQYYASNAGLNTEKVNTESAKQRHLMSDADRKDLEFIEQESGVNHARDMQKQQAQAKGNIALELVKSRMKSDKESKPK